MQRIFPAYRVCFFRVSNKLFPHFPRVSQGFPRVLCKFPRVYFVKNLTLHSVSAGFPLGIFTRGGGNWRFSRVENKHVAILHHNLIALDQVEIFEICY